MSSSEMARLARFRASKRSAQEAEERRHRAWDAATLGPARRRLAGWIGGTREEEQLQQVCENTLSMYTTDECYGYVECVCPYAEYIFKATC